MSFSFQLLSKQKPSTQHIQIVPGILWPWLFFLFFWPRQNLTPAYNADPAFVCMSSFPSRSRLEEWKASSFFSPHRCLRMIYIFFNAALLECWLSKNFPYFIFFPLSPLGSIFFDNQLGLLFFLFSFWWFTFWPLKLKLFGVGLEFWQFKFKKKKPSWGNQFWHIRILTQSLTGLMGWLRTSLCFSQVHLCIRVVFCLFFWGIFKKETSVILSNVPLSEVYWRTELLPKKSECYYCISFIWTCFQIFLILTSLKWRKLL